MKKYLLLLLLIIFFSCNKDEKALYSRLETTEYSEITKEREAELKADIRKYKDILEENIETLRGIGSCTKSLGKLYLENKMYFLALEQFKESMKIYPENPILFYYAGVCSAKSSKLVIEDTEKYEYISDSVEYYKKAIELDNKFTKALYALSIIYLFELDRPKEAALLLNNIMGYESSNYEAMFLLANAYIRIGRIDDASDIYEKIIKSSGNRIYTEKAESNRKELQENIYEWN